MRKYDEDLIICGWTLWIIQPAKTFTNVTQFAFQKSECWSFRTFGAVWCFWVFFPENSKTPEYTYAADYVKRLALMSINVDSGKFREKMPAEKYVLSTYETWGRKKFKIIWQWNMEPH